MPKMNKRLIALIIGVTFLLQGAGLERLYVKAPAPKDALRPIAAAASADQGLFDDIGHEVCPLVRYGIRPWDQKELQERFEYIIHIVKGDGRLKRSPRLRDKVMRELGLLQRQVMYSRPEEMGGIERANFLLNIAHRYKNIIIAVQDSATPLYPCNERSAFVFCRFLERLTFPDELLSKILEFDEDRRHERIPDNERLEQFEGLLKKLYGVTFDEVIISMLNMAGQEHSPWININSHMRSSLADALQHKNHNLLKNYISFNIYITSYYPSFHLKGSRGAGNRYFAYLIHYFARKAAEERLSRESAKKGFPGPTGIKTVFFDVADVILIEHLDHAARALAPYCDKEEEFIFSVLRHDESWFDLDAGKITPKEYFERINLKLGLDMGYNAFLKIWRDIYEVNPDVVRVIRELKRAGYKIYALPNANRAHREYYCKRYGYIFKMLDGFIASYKVGFIKPDERIFERALEVAKVGPQEAILIDDREVNVEGAAALGITSLQYKRGMDLKSALKNLIIHQMRLMDYLKAQEALGDALKSKSERGTKAANKDLHNYRERLWLESDKRRLGYQSGKFKLGVNELVYDIRTKEVFLPGRDGCFHIKNIRKRSGSADLVILSPSAMSVETRFVKEELEEKLNDMSLGMGERLSALRRLKEMEKDGLIPPPYPVPDVFQHCHTKYSYSPYLPIGTLWRGYQLGLQVIGIVDHDTIDGDIELKKGAEILGFKNASLGSEVRATITHKLFGSMTINSPDNIAEAYICLHGIPGHKDHKFFRDIRTAKRQRFRKSIGELNDISVEVLLSVLGLYYDRDVKPLAMRNNPTERHLAEAIARNILARDCSSNAERIRYAQRLINAVRRRASAELEEKLEDVSVAEIKKSIAKLDNFVVFLRDGLIKPLRILHPPTMRECPPLEKVVEFAHSQGWLVLYPYLGGGLCEAESEENLGRFFRYLKRCGIDGLAFMPDRNTKKEIKMIRRLAKKVRLKLYNGMDVNKEGMPYTNEYSNDPELVEGAFVIIKLEQKNREAARAASAGTNSALDVHSLDLKISTAA